ncbi:MAG: sugar O-acetyltransferase [Oscillospiraceae bacterium]|nr:sugar O-acetyltransferase [Oscillospiraceae bacterium]
MTEKEKMLAGQLYSAADGELQQLSLEAKRRLRAYNSAPPDDEALRSSLLRAFFKKTGADIWIEPPFYCDYGVFTEIGERFYANVNLTILDSAPVVIGDDVMFGPNVSLFTATHTLDFRTRSGLGLELAKPITIGSGVWLGGGVIVLPGVSIGDRAVIGAGSVVTKDVPARTLACGNPCRALKKIDPEPGMDV